MKSLSERIRLAIEQGVGNAATALLLETWADEAERYERQIEKWIRSDPSIRIGTADQIVRDIETARAEGFRRGLLEGRRKRSAKMKV